MTEQPDRLYGVPGAERMQLDIASVYETDIEPDMVDDEHGGVVLTPRIVEEWTVKPATEHLPSTRRIIEWVVETTVDEAIDENWYEDCERAGDHPDVVAAFTAARELLASKVAYWMADKVVATHTITWADPDTPLIDGEPLYRRKERTT